MCWKKGQLLMEAKPYVLIILNQYRHERCNFCLTRFKNLQKCGVCKEMRYCSRTCQREDWKIHKMECPIMKGVPHQPADSIRLYLRLILLYVKGKSSVKFETTESPCLRSFNDLESHSKEIRKDKTRYDLFRKASDFVQVYALEILKSLTEDDLLDIFGKMVINTFTVADELLQDIAVALYNSPSILDHRCCPNAVVSFNGRNVMVQAVENIAVKDFTKVYISYLDPVASLAERQQQLWDQYYFICQCVRCQDSDLDYLMRSTLGSNEGDENWVKQCLEYLDAMAKDNEVSPCHLVEYSQKCLSSVMLPSSNVYLVRLISRTYDLAIEAQLWKEAVALGRRNLRPYKELNPDYTVSVGHMMANLGKLLVFLGDVYEARSILMQAFEVLLICLGHKHSLVHQVKDMLLQCDMECKMDHDIGQNTN